MTNLKSYSERRSWSDAHMEQVKSALGKKLFMTSNFRQDTKFATDLFIDETTLAVRIRQGKYSAYLDFTFRTSHTGFGSEYSKMLSKVAPHYLFYGYALDDKQLMAGYLIDLKQWKLALMNKEIQPQFKRNRDGSHFVAFPLKLLKGYASYVEQIL